MSNSIKIYEPGNKHKGFWSLLRDMFSDLKEAKTLGLQLFKRDKKGEYSQSLLGIFWAVLTPFFTALIWIFLNASGAVNVKGTQIPYPVFVFLGTSLWAVFTESINAPLKETMGAKSILTKVNFPKESILISGILKLFFNLSIKMLLIIGILFFFKIQITTSILWFPVVVLILILFGFSIGLLITPLGMLYKDVGSAIPIGLSIFMFMTPVVYPTTRIKSINQFIGYNPLTPIINSCRNTLTGFPLDNPTYLIIIFIVSVLIFILGWLFYRISIPILVERM